MAAAEAIVIYLKTMETPPRQPQDSNLENKPIGEFIDELVDQIPEEAWKKVPSDLSAGSQGSSESGTGPKCKFCVDTGKLSNGLPCLRCDVHKEWSSTYY